jgi:cbb3-type cytochrome oxidase maturation protein
MEELTFVQFLVALCMSLSALSLFIWAVLSGMFHDVEKIKYRAYRAEVNDDE